MKDIVTIEQMDYVRRLKAPDEQIALNNALIEYVFGCLVCLLNKIPVLLIGNPGSSKSLSMRLIQSNLRGKGSPSEFCRQFP
jgi:MoxR-like ATPase